MSVRKLSPTIASAAAKRLLARIPKGGVGVVPHVVQGRLDGELPSIADVLRAQGPHIVMHEGMRRPAHPGERVYRVVEASGAICGGETRATDGGGFRVESDAQALAAQINERRAAKKA